MTATKTLRIQRASGVATIVIPMAMWRRLVAWAKANPRLATANSNR